MSAENYPDTMSNTAPPAPWWRATPRDWPERIFAFLLGPLAFVCVYGLGGRGPLGLAAGIACAVLILTAFVWWQRRRTPRPRQRREAEAAAGR